MRKTKIVFASLLALLLVCGGAPVATLAGGAAGPASFLVVAQAEDPTPAPTPSPSPSPAPTAAPVVSDAFVIDAQLGYDGAIVMGRWVPCVINIANEGDDFEGTVGINVFLSQTQYDRYEIPLTLAGGASKQVILPLVPRVRQDMYAVELVRDGRIIAEQRIAPRRIISPEAMTIGVLSETPAALSYMDKRTNDVNTLRGEPWITIPLTAETFPTSGNLMDGFTMLVVDGVDVRMLSQDQQDALSAWVLKGGVVYVSGGAKAADSYPFFTRWTGLEPGKLTQAEDITPTLLSYMTTKGKAAEESIWINELPADGALIRYAPEAGAEGDGEDAAEAAALGLVYMDRVGNGLICTAAFDLSGKPLSSWTSMGAFWPRSLRQGMSTFYNNMLNRLDNIRYNNDSYQVNDLLQRLRVKNTDSGIPVLLLLLLYLVLAGFGGYFLLKKLDRREWLWVFVPCVAVGFAVVILLMSGGSTMNKPVATTASRISLSDEGTQMTTYIGVAAADIQEMTIETDQQRLPTVVTDDGYYYDYDGTQTDRLFRPVDLRQRFQLGANPKVGFASSSAWSTKKLMLEGARQDMGMVDATLWMEDGDVRGEVINNTSAALEDCMVVTNFGFSLLGELLPGQSETFTLARPATPVNRNDPQFRFEPGVLYASLDLDPQSYSGYGYSVDYVGNFISAAIYGKANDYADNDNRRKETLINMYSSEYNFYRTGASYYFFGFSQDLGKINIRLNDKAVDRTGHVAVVGSQMLFEPIGPTGDVFFHEGLIPAEIVVDQGDDKKPRLPTDEDREQAASAGMYSDDDYVSLAEPVAVRFVLPDHGAFTIDRMVLATRAHDTLPEMFLYNHEKGQWDEQLLLSLSMTGEEWAPYIDEGGELYIRYVPLEDSGRYSSMSKPTITLRGEVE